MSRRRRQMRKAATGIVALLVLGATAAGCGGGSSSESEGALRKQLASAAAKLTDAKSLRASVAFEAVEDGVPEELGCVTLSIDTHGKPERFDLGFLDQNCTGGLEAHEMIAIGRRAWSMSSDDTGHWREATILPSLLKELDDERTSLGGLIAAAEDIESEPEGGTVEEDDAIFVDVTSYTFTAPASAFPGTDVDLEDVDVEFEVLVDRKGYLRELVLIGETDGLSASVTEKFEEIGENLGIGPPYPSEVHGKVTKIRTQSDLERFFGVSTH